jgi:hypothetical protein
LPALSVAGAHVAVPCPRIAVQIAQAYGAQVFAIGAHKVTVALSSARASEKSQGTANKDHASRGDAPFRERTREGSKNSDTGGMGDAGNVLLRVAIDRAVLTATDAIFGGGLTCITVRTVKPVAAI